MDSREDGELAREEGSNSRYCGYQYFENYREGDPESWCLAEHGELALGVGFTDHHGPGL